MVLAPKARVQQNLLFFVINQGWEPHICFMMGLFRWWCFENLWSAQGYFISCLGLPTPRTSFQIWYAELPFQRYIHTARHIGHICRSPEYEMRVQTKHNCVLFFPTSFKKSITTFQVSFSQFELGEKGLKMSLLDTKLISRICICWAVEGGWEWRGRVAELGGRGENTKCL